MKCPYCTSAIDDAALACPHCTRDLYLFKPLLARIGELEQKLVALEGRVAEIGASRAVEVVVPPAPESERHEAEPGWSKALLLWVAPLLLLLVAHVLITVVYDLDTLYLRVVSLLIPLPFGVLLMSRQRRSLGRWAAAAFVMATLAVLGMSGITHLVDHTAVLPNDRREWAEFIEYAASVGLSHVAGIMLGRMLWQRREAGRREDASRLAYQLARLVSTGQEKVDRINQVAKKLQELSGSLTAAGTTAASVYLGLHGYLGK